MMNPSFSTHQNSSGDSHRVLPPAQQRFGLDDYMRERAARVPTDWTAPRHFFTDGSMDGSSVSSFAHSTSSQPTPQFPHPSAPPSTADDDRNAPQVPAWQAPRHFFDNTVDGSTITSFAPDHHPISQSHVVTPGPPSVMSPPATPPNDSGNPPLTPAWQAPRHLFDNTVDDSTIGSFAPDHHPISQFHVMPPSTMGPQASTDHEDQPPSTPVWQAPRHLFDNSVDGSSVVSFPMDRHRLSQFQPPQPPSLSPPSAADNEGNTPQIPSWQAPRHLFDDDSDDGSSIFESSHRRPFDWQQNATIRQRPPAVSVFGQNSNAAAAASSSAQLVHSNTDVSEIHGDVRGNSAFSGGGFGNTTRDEDPEDLVPCFGNAVVLQEEDYDPFDPRSSRPVVAANENILHQPSHSAEEAPQRRRITVVPRVADLNFASVVKKEEKEGTKPMTDLERFERMYPIRGGMPREPVNGKAYFWKTLPCQYRVHPWIADIYRMYHSLTQNKDVKKEAESRGLIMPVEHYHNANYDYAKCWIFNTEFRQKMMIVPYWCFPHMLPRLGTIYEASLRMVMSRVGGRVRLTMRIKFGSEVKEAQHQNGHYLGVSTEILESPGCWCKILSIHCRLIQNRNLSLFAREFEEVIYDKSQIKEFPKGANFVEGNAFIQPLPGLKGTIALYGKDDEPCFYLIREFRQSAVDYTFPKKTVYTEEQMMEWARKREREREKTRYEWQPRSESSVVHARKKKPLDDKPVLRLSSAGNLSKSERVLLTIEILRRIRARESEFQPLSPENVYRLECVVGDREVRSKSTRLRDVTERLHKMISAEGPYNWIKEKEPATMKDLFEIIKMNVNYFPNGRDSIAPWLRPIMFPENEESDYEEWD